MALTFRRRRVREPDGTMTVVEHLDELRRRLFISLSAIFLCGFVAWFLYDPVYRFLGVEGLAAEKMPEPGQLVASRLGYFIRPGKHSMTRGDWKVYLDFADKHLPATGREK